MQTNRQLVPGAVNIRHIPLSKLVPRAGKSKLKAKPYMAQETV